MTIMTDAWKQLPHAFDLDPAFIHLSSAMFASHPLPVREAIEKHRSGFDKNPILYYRNKKLFETETLKKAALYLETHPEKIALTESTTMGLALVYRGLQWNKSDEILTTVHEHYAALETLRILKKREGVQIKYLTLYEEARNTPKERLISQIVDAITPNTKVVALTWVHSSTGLKLPLQEICTAIEKINASREESDQILIAVDGLHGLGIENLQVEQLGVDFFIAGCHKSFFGPRGTGFVWGSQRGWKRMSPLLTSFKEEAFFAWFEKKGVEDHCPKAFFCTPGGFQAYEHRWALAEAFDFHLDLGKERISQKIHALNTYCKKKMECMPGVVLHTPQDPSLSSGMVCFEVVHDKPHLVVEKLLAKGIISGQTPYHRTFCRFTPGLINDEEQIDVACRMLEEIL